MISGISNDHATPQASATISSEMYDIRPDIHQERYCNLFQLDIALFSQRNLRLQAAVNLQAFSLLEEKYFQLFNQKRCISNIAMLSALKGESGVDIINAKRQTYQ